MTVDVHRQPPPTFVLPALSALRWAGAFTAGMLAVPPPHHTWAWLCLLPMCAHTWRALRRAETFIAAKVALKYARLHQLEAGEEPEHKW